MKHTAVLLVLAALLSSTLPARSQSADAPAARHAYTRPHVLRYATGEDVAGLNPLLVQQTTVSLMSSLTMAWFVKFDRRNKPYPELITTIPTKQNGGISSDGKTIVYHLRRDVKWSDGHPFDASDVAFTVAQVLNPANNILSREGWNKISKVETPDPYTVVFHLTQPYGSYIPTFFTSAGANPCVLPKHLFAGLSDINTAPYNSLPVGTGPFTYKSWQRGDSIELVANPSYFRGRPKLEKVIFKIVPDRNTVMTQLQTHELDLWYNVPGSFFERLESTPGVRTLKTPSFTFGHLDFNLAHPVLSDLAVRKAILYATDRKTLRDTVGHRLGILQDAILSPAHPNFDPHLGFTPFDLTKANAILDAAGWIRGADGVRAKDGVRLNLNFAAPSGAPDNDSQIELMRGWWKSAGIEIDLRHYVSSLLFGPYQSGGILYNGKFDVAIFAWNLDAVGDASGLYACDRVPPKGQNVEHYCSREVDRALEAFRREYDPGRRRPYAWTVQRRLVQDIPSVVLTVRETTWAMNDDLKGFTPNSSTYFDNMMDTDL